MDIPKKWTSHILLLLLGGDPEDSLLGSVSEVVVPSTHVYAGTGFLEPEDRNDLGVSGLFDLLRYGGIPIRRDL